MQRKTASMPDVAGIKRDREGHGAAKTFKNFLVLRAGGCGGELNPYAPRANPNDYMHTCTGCAVRV